MYENEDFILQFCELVGCDPEQAAQFMDISGGDMDTAVTIYFESGGIQQQEDDHVVDLAHEMDASSDDEIEEVGDLRRVYEHDEIYRPRNTRLEEHSANIFNEGGNVDNELAKKFDLPDCIKGPYLLEKAREIALYSDQRKYVLLCLYKRKSFEGACINRDIFHDQMVIEIMKENFIVVQHFIPDDQYELCEGNRLREVYSISSFPFIGVINPMSGYLVSTISERYCRDTSLFLERITTELENNPISGLPHLGKPSIVMQTSNHHPVITPSRIVPLESQRLSFSPRYIESTHNNSSKYEETVTNNAIPKINEISKKPELFRDISTTPGAAACRIRVRMPSSTATLCVVKTATIEEFVAYLIYTQEELKDKEIDVLFGNPPISLLKEEGKTLDKLKLNGSALIVRPIDEDEDEMI